jgi:ABC-type multidrug transport system ATPase subunit
MFLLRSDGKVLLRPKLRRIEAGKVVGFVGPNGASKTTAMRAVLGATALDSGRIEFEGR